MSELNKEIVLYGIPGSPGVSHGQVFRFLHGNVEVPQYQVSVSEQEAELGRFRDAIEITRSQIEEIRKEVTKNLGEKEAGIFDAHIMVLEDQVTEKRWPASDQHLGWSRLHLRRQAVRNS